MKAIQITIDEDLLREVNASEEVRREGRSALFRRAAVEYLRKKRESEIARRYAHGYQGRPGLGAGYEHWEEQGEWPKTE
ncbi:MAG TPA: ribbon-helix-helix protein, CopG family [Thermoanaerobaculia bacterium]|nr:ribbon-helix-helix protein, CopG family [Thermoanaerobaculia bacterium]